MKNLMILTSLLVCFVSSAHADELTLLFIRSPKINWGSPRSLAKTTVSSATKKYSLGHVNIRIACSGQPTVHTGIFNRFNGETTDAVLKHGQGLGVLFNLFEGKLQLEKKIVPTFEKLSKDNRTNFVTFKISPTTCQRVLDYHYQYQSLAAKRTALPRVHRQKADEDQQIFYGFPAIPRYGEGGGCSGFAVSFLEVAGIKEQWMVDEWSQSLRVPVESVGMPMRPVSINLTSMLFSSPQRWATELEPHFPMFLWDPDMMIDSTNKRMLARGARMETMYGSRGYSLDRTMVPTPTEPLFLNDPENRPTDPRAVYSDIKELERRFSLSKEISH